MMGLLLIFLYSSVFAENQSNKIQIRWIRKGSVSETVPGETSGDGEQQNGTDNSSTRRGRRGGSALCGKQQIQALCRMLK